ncbi:MAG: oligosaccharide flippase family protein [Paludibacteraceae bacterium]|nr:oligosaccharide flippase family protein [Paludibacteraceae bacterium]
MAEMKKLAAQTAIYGVSSIFGRFLNWCLAPMYTFVLASQSEYGIYTNIYAWTALLMVILTYGMETGFFRFVNKEENNPKSVYSTVLWCVAFTSTIFSVIAVLLSPNMASALQIDGHADFVSIMCVTVAIDAFCCIPMAYLRYKNKAVKFAMVNLIMIAVNIFFNVFFLVLCPFLYKNGSSLVGWFNPTYSVGYVFVANFISTISKVVMLLPEVKAAGFSTDKPLLKKILRYSFPLLILGVAGIMNQTLDKILFPIIYTWGGHTVEEAQTQLGIYGACFKVAMVMMMFTQAFRYAYEPFVFAKNKGEDKKKEYADAMKFFVIFSLLIFLGMVFFLDVLKLIINKDYWEGLAVVPVVLVSYLFQGVYFNLSLWYKLTDKTHFGAIFSVVGLVITLVVNVVGVPGWGYWASAVASLICFSTITLVSYFAGQHYYPVNYDLKSIGLYAVVAMAMFAVSRISPLTGVLAYLQNVVMLGAYLALLFKRDLPITAVPVVGRFFRK